MFTGIVEAAVPVLRFEPRGRGARLELAAPAAAYDVAAGDSICVSGACLTLAELRPDPAGGPPALAFDLSSETLERTWFGALAVLPPGRRVNLERALQLGDRLGGHLVSGHVDGLGRLLAIEDSADGGARLEFEVAPGLERYLIDKGSIALDGASLTVVAPRGRRFHAALIPFTLAQTSLGSAALGDPVHVEVDLVGKWIERLMPGRT